MKRNLLKIAGGLQSGIFVIATFLCLLLSTGVYANNIAVTNVSLTSPGVGYTMVQFDISWENSFRVSHGPNNWDAAWVFVKYRIKTSYGGDGTWKHAWLNENGHTAPLGSTLAVGLVDPKTAFNISTNPAIGAFLYRSGDGVGTFSKTGVQLRWNYAQNFKTGSTPIGSSDVMDVQVYAIEMIYVPQAAFYLGTGGTESGAFFTSPNVSTPYQVTGEAAITVGTTAGNLYYDNSLTSQIGDRNGPIPALFPKGFAAFYCMKYEVSQQGYVDFLNSLTRLQQDTRTATSLPIGTTSVTNRYVMINSVNPDYRHIIRCDATIDANAPINFYCDANGNGIGGDLNDGRDIALNTSQNDLYAYLDWSGLRPMTELEYEKACRGNQAPVPNEFAWGSTSIVNATSYINSGANNEVASNLASGANCAGNWYGPIRVGSFASAASSRQSAGATYYGITDMTGNMEETTITVGNATGRAFTGTHGNGLLSTIGNGDQTTWTGSVGNGWRGGTYWSGNLQVSNRYYSVYDYGNNRNYISGGRGVRTMP